MMFIEIFRFEFIYQMRRAWPWLIFIVLTVLSFLMTRDGTLAEALHDDFFVNSPFAVAKTTITGSLVWLLIAAGIAGEAAARDITTGMHPLVYTTQVSKSAYLGGRFLAGFLLNAMLLLGVQLGILLAVYSPGVDKELVGPFRVAAYLTAFAYLSLPNAFIGTVIQFWAATQQGKPLAAYLGSILLFFMSFVVGLFLLFQGRQELANVLDPIGVHFILSELSHLWTPTEKSWRLLTLEGTILANRAIWISIGMAMLTVTYIRFKFTHHSAGARWLKIFKRKHTSSLLMPEHEFTKSAAINVLPAGQSDGLTLQFHQMTLIARDSFFNLAKSWAGLALLVAIPAMAVPVVVDQMVINEVPMIPTTARVISELTAPLVAEMSRWIIVPLLIIFYAGALIYRERDYGISEMTDTMPGSEWAPFLGKFIGLSTVLALFTALLIVSGIIGQIILGYHDFDIGLYLSVMFGLQLPEYLLFALLAMAIHVIVHHKYIGHLVAILVWVMITLASLFGMEHNLLIYSASPEWSYTEMNGFGWSLAPWIWFKLYWSSWAILLAVAAKLFWVRGKTPTLRERLQSLRIRFTRGTAFTTGVALMLIIFFGGYIFYNTNILNDYITKSEITGRAANYELRYAQYADDPQPTPIAKKLEVDIFPRRRAVDIQGYYKLSNRSASPIGQIHLATVPGVQTTNVNFDRTSKLTLSDQDLGYQIYTLTNPLKPGDSLTLSFKVHVEYRGFRENGIDESVAENGTYFSGNDWLPQIGYQRDHELTGAADRRKYALPPRPLIASLYDPEPRKRTGVGIAFESIISTDKNQVVVSSGVLRETWIQNGRRYYRYSSDGPISDQQYFFSASYMMHDAQWKDPTRNGKTVAIRIYHHPKHTANLDRMIQSTKESLDYYTRQFGPYASNQLTFIEYPGDGDGAGIHAEAGMLMFEEGFSFWNPGKGAGNLDHPYAVVAHEIAHQWTVPYANVEGAPVLSESVAWYYGMKLLQHARGQEQLERLLTFMRQPHPHPPIRHGEPLLRGLDPYLSYRRGPFALYALSEYIGTDRVNTALHRLVEKHRRVTAPLATTLDLFAALRAVTPDSLQYLLHDLFEVNTYWELRTKEVTATQRPDGSWNLSIDVQVRKTVSDSAGTEKVVPMNDWIEVGIYGNRSGNNSVAQFYLQKHRLRSGRQIFFVNVPFKPVRAGIDPRSLLIDLEPGNNTQEVK